MLRQIGHVRPASSESASVIGARGAPQNAPRPPTGASMTGPVPSVRPSSSISSYSDVRRAVASAALDSLNPNASRSSDNTTNWIDELLLGSSVGTGGGPAPPSSSDVLR